MSKGITITARTVAEAEKLAAVRFSPRQRELVLIDIEAQLARVASLRDVPLANDLAPATVFDPRLPGAAFDEVQRPVVLPDRDPGSVPERDEDIAFAPLLSIGAWLRRGSLTSKRLTEIYLERLQRLGPELECVVTLTEGRAMAQARAADEELAAGRYRGPLHGVPWGAKDLLDTAGISTTWGARPYRDRIAARDAAVVRRLDEAGAVLVAKTALGALAYGDVWFGGRTRNPWNRDEGSRGSSAGSAAAVAAGLVGFAIGTETLGSIVSPCMRCGTAGLRPTFGRVSRTGAMALCWSLDKIGPLCRRVEDAAPVLAAINGHDPDDPGSIGMPFNFDARRSVRGLRVGYDPRWLEEAEAEPLDREVLDVARDVGLEVVALALPDLPYQALWTVLQVESAAAFEELTLGGRDELLVRQDADAWPNRFRRARFVSAVDFVQAQRFRRLVMQEMARIYERVDALIGPSFAGQMQLISNFTGHPSLTLRTGFVEKATRADLGVTDHAAGAGTGHRRVPHGTTLWGRLFDEGTLLGMGVALEDALAVWDERPAV